MSPLTKTVSLPLVASLIAVPSSHGVAIVWQLPPPLGEA
jgi:hypothetical protein